MQSIFHLPENEKFSPKVSCEDFLERWQLIRQQEPANVALIPEQERNQKPHLHYTLCREKKKRNQKCINTLFVINKEENFEILSKNEDMRDGNWNESVGEFFIACIPSSTASYEENLISNACISNSRYILHHSFQDISSGTKSLFDVKIMYWYKWIYVLRDRNDFWINYLRMTIWKVIFPKIYNCCHSYSDKE